MEQPPAADLRGAVLESLPPAVRALLDEIESFAGQVVRFEKNPFPISQTNPNPLAPALACNNVSARVMLREGSLQDAQGILHELLHLRRFWVDGIPQLVPKVDNEGNWGVTGSVENDLEHLVIVPREADYGFDPYPYWNATLTENWARYPWPEMTNKWARRKNLLLGWLSVAKICNDQALEEHARACLAKEGMLAEAQRFVTRVSKALPDKAKALAEVVSTLRIPRDDVRLLYIDIRTGTARYEPVAKVPKNL